MNKYPLLEIMDAKNDSVKELAEYLVIAIQTLYKKMNGNAEFTQSEIQAIISRYNLTPEQVQKIFFAKKCSSKEQRTKKEQK